MFFSHYVDLSPWFEVIALNHQKTLILQVFTTNPLSLIPNPALKRLSHDSRETVSIVTF